MPKTGEFYRCAKSGVVVLVVKEGNATLRTEHGDMERKVLDVLDDSLELIDDDLDSLSEDVAARDRGPRQAF
ncbi:MAG: hypothetical protein GY711_06105 [bacterium]|nr:hypothetical protein [bacterium]